MVHGQLNVVLRHIHKLGGAPGLDGFHDGQLLERFADGREEAAFTALVQRHGPLVLGVCRRVLGNAHDAEDAFQATFLILLRRAHALDRRGSVAGWLHTVAYHVALRARAAAARRQRQERQVAAMADSNSPTAEAWTDLQPVLDEELSRLPESYRSAVLLCYLQGKTNAEAARMLGWPIGTVKGRLFRARDMLRKRLARRGVTLSAGTLTAALAENASAAVPASLVQATVQTGVLAVGGATAVGSSSALALAEGALKTMFVTKLRIATALLFLAGLLALGAGVFANPRPPQRLLVDNAATVNEPTRMKVVPVLAPAKGKTAGQERTFAGNVLGEGKKPLAGATVALVGWPESAARPGPFVMAQATTDKEGKFRLKVKPALSSGPAGEALIAAAAGHGLGWCGTDKTEGVEITLAAEQVIRGRLLDVQGQPAANVKLLVSRLGGLADYARMVDYMLVTSWHGEEVDDDFDPAPDALLGVRYRTSVVDREKLLYARSMMDAYRIYGTGPAPGGASSALVFRHGTDRLLFWPHSVTTDAEGRFTLRGVGRGQGAGLMVRDERFAIQALNLPPQTADKSGEVPLVLQPARVLEGTVTDTVTGQPVPYARLKVASPFRSFRVASGAERLDADWRGRPTRDVAVSEALAVFSLRGGLGPVDELPTIEVRADDKGRFRLPLFTAEAYTVRLAGAPGAPYLSRTHAGRLAQEGRGSPAA
jgi:RNA polymerase sigma factor (sigma-70 family)